VWLSQNTDAGISVLHEGSWATVTDSIVRETLAKPGQANADGAPGIEVRGGGGALVDHCRIEMNRMEGIGVGDSGSTAEIVDSLISDTLPGGPSPSTGRGVSVFDGATASVSASLITGSVETGLSVRGEETVVELASSSICDTTPDSDGGGCGIGVSGAALVGTDLWVSGNAGMGICVQYAGSLIDLSRSVIQDTLPAFVPRFSGEAFGRGVDLHGVESASIEACLIQGNAEVGVRMMSEDGALAVRGTIIRETRHHESGLAAGGYGMGLVAMGGAQAEVAYCLVDDNDTAGVACHETGTSLRVRRSALLDTNGGKSWYDPEIGGEVQEAFGDGAYVVDGGELVIEDTVIARNKRTGVYFSKSAGQVEGTVIHGNNSYGIAVDDPDGLVEYQDGGNLVFGNALDLPTPEARQTTTAPGGIPLPDVSEWPSWD